MGRLRYNRCKVPTGGIPLKEKMTGPQAKIDILSFLRE
jgi:hypothetical protein